MIEVRGNAMVILLRGNAFGERFKDTIVRIHPTRVVSFGNDSGELSSNARSVGAGRLAERFVAAIVASRPVGCQNWVTVA